MSKKFDLTIYELQAEVSKITGASQSNVSQHLAILRQRQIVKTRKAGSSIYYRVASPKISQACDMIREVLLEQLNQKQEIANTHLSKGTD